MSALLPPRPIVLPLWPEWAAQVASGRKLVEFRRRPFPCEPGQAVYIYATAPAARVVAKAVAKVDGGIP